MVVMGNNVILTLPNGENRQDIVKGDYKFTVNGSPATVYELRQGMVVSAEKIVEEPAVQLASNTTVVGTPRVRTRLPRRWLRPGGRTGRTGCGGSSGSGCASAQAPEDGSRFASRVCWDCCRGRLVRNSRSAVVIQGRERGPTLRPRSSAPLSTDQRRRRPAPCSNHPRGIGAGEVSSARVLTRRDEEQNTSGLPVRAAAGRHRPAGRFGRGVDGPFGLVSLAVRAFDQAQAA